MMSDEQVKKLAMRLPSDLHAEIARRAKADRRSIHGEIVYFLYEQIKKQSEESPQQQAA